MDPWETVFNGRPMSFQMFEEKWPGLVSLKRRMSALPPIADIHRRCRNVRFVPIADNGTLFDHLVDASIPLWRMEDVHARPKRKRSHLISSCAQVRGDCSISGLDVTARAQSNLSFPFE